MIKYWLMFVYFIFSTNLLADTRKYEVIEVRATAGDELVWAEESFDDRKWQKLEFGLTPDFEGNYWLRISLRVLEQLSSEQATELFLHIMGSSQVYWDGRLIGVNGHVGHNQKSEIPGQIDQLFVVPSYLYQPGVHLVTIRVSRHYPSLIRMEMRYDFELGAYGETYSQHSGLALIPVITLGGTLVVGFYFIAIFLLDRKRVSFFLFGLTCLGVAGMLVSESWRGVLGYTYDWHIIRLRAILCFSLLVAISLPWFVFYYFKFQQFKKHLVVCSLMIMGIANLFMSYDFRATILLLLGLLVALIITLIAWYQRRTDAPLLVTAIGVTLLGGVLTPYQFIDETFFYLFPFMTILILISVAFQNRQNRHQRDAALIYSTRLKTELLKKNIQPHFILNTLTSLASWIAIEPKTADKMLHSLAQEFRSLMEMSDEKLVPFTKEIELCQSHLQVMGYRKDIQFELLFSEIKNDLMIPPGIIHTLVENALSHNRYSDNLVKFRLSTNIQKNSVKLELKIPIGKQKNSTTNTGSGTQYIKARLEEAWPNICKFDSYQQADFWITHIEFPETYKT